MLDFFIVILCLVINAFFSAYEMAFVTVSKEELGDLEESSKSLFKKISLFKKKPERTLSVIQIGITLVGAIAAAVGGTGAVESLEPYIVKNYGLSTSVAEGIAVTIVIIPLTYFSVVFGELLPKTVALKYPTKILYFGTRTLGLIDKFLSPIVTFLEISTNFLLKTLKMGDKIEEDESLGQTVDIGNLPDYHQRFVQNLVDLKGRRVSRVMKPWKDVAFLNFSESEEEIRARMHQSFHSRFPVVDGDTLVGLLYRKELPENQAQHNFPWQGILRPAIKLKESEKVLEAFLEMQKKRDQMAIVTDSNDRYIGIVTIEDILEEVVGDIDDYIDQGRIKKMLSNRGKISLKS
jgi:putative hemolysin